MCSPHKKKRLELDFGFILVLGFWVRVKIKVMALGGGMVALIKMGGALFYY